MYLTLRSTRLGWDEKPRCAWNQRHELVGPFFFFFFLFFFVSQSKEYPLKHKHTRLLLAEPQDKAHQCTGVGSTPVE